MLLFCNFHRFHNFNYHNIGRRIMDHFMPWIGIGTLAVAAIGAFIEFRFKQNAEIEKRVLLSARVDELERRFSERHLESEERNKKFYDIFDEIKKNQNDLKVMFESFSTEIRTELKHLNGTKNA